MKKIIIAAAALLISAATLKAQNQNQDSIRIHVIQNVNGNILDIDTAVAASQQQNLFNWLSSQGIEMQELPAAGDSIRMIQIVVNDSSETNGSQMRIPNPPLPPDAPQMRIVTIDHEGPPVPGEEIEIVVSGDTVHKIVRHQQIIVTDNISKVAPPTPPSPPSPPSPPQAPSEKKSPDATNEKLDVYPNPTSGKITIEFEMTGTKTEISVTDMNGKLVYSEQIGEAATGLYKKEISLGTSKGAYTVQVKKGNAVLVRKILVQ